MVDTKKYGDLTREEKRARNLATVQQFSFGGTPGMTAQERQLQWQMDAVRGVDKSERAKLGGLVDTQQRLKHNKQRIADEKAASTASTETDAGDTVDTGQRYVRDETPERTEGPEGKASAGRTAEEWAALGEMGKASQAYEAAGGTWSTQKHRDLSAALKAGTIATPTGAEMTTRRAEQVTGRKAREAKGWFNVEGSFRGKTAEEWYRAGRPGLAREALLGTGKNYLYGEAEQEKFRTQRREWDKPVDLEEEIDVDNLGSFNLEGIKPFTYLEMTDANLLSDRLAQIINKNGTLYKSAVTRVYQIMQGRGIANSSIAEEAVMSAILSVAVPIATHEVNELSKLMYHNNGLTNDQIRAENKFIYDSMLKKVDGAIQFNLNEMIQNAGSWRQWIVSATAMMSKAGVDAKAIDQWRNMVSNMQR